jgi:hypothetical protein
MGFIGPTISGFRCGCVCRCVLGPSVVGWWPVASGTGGSIIGVSF